jgi:hypothetical protein
MESTSVCTENLLPIELDFRQSQSHRPQQPERLEEANPDESYTAPLSCEVEARRSVSTRGGMNRRCRQRSMLSAAAALVLCSSTMLPTAIAVQTTSCFVNPPIFSTSTSPDSSMSILSKTPMRRTNFATNFPPSTTSRRSDTWSNAVRQKSGLNESRFGVRRRVKSVLDKAKKRTGIDNSSVEKDDGPYVQTGPNIVAEAASIGGWGAVVIDEEGYVDTDLDSDSDRGDSFYEDAVASDSVSGDIFITSEIRNGATDTPISAPIEGANLRKDDSILGSTNSDQSNSTIVVDGSAVVEKDNAAGRIPDDPLPFTMPTLTREQKERVMRGERVQFQDDMGRAGSGFVVWDVKAPASVVWNCLLDFQSYPQTIPTVREVVMYTNTHLKEDYRAEKPLDFEDGTAAICKHGVPSVTRAQFYLSKFRLKIAAVHKYRPHSEGDYMIFTLDPASRNMVLKYAKGIWHTQSSPDGKEGYTRVWLLCELSVSRLLPQWIVDYAAARAMPRATTWLKPQVEAAATLWLKDSAGNY